MRIDQLLDGFADGDAISNEARVIRDRLRTAGVESEIFAPRESTGHAVADEARPLDDITDAGKIIYHYSTFSSATEAYLVSRAERIVRYHNITPAGFFEAYDDHLARSLTIARERLPKVLEAAGSVCAVSEFNATEARGMADVPVSVVPLLFEPRAESDAGHRVAAHVRQVLFVGRIVPNKCVEDLILAFAWLNGSLLPGARLFLVGSDRSCPKYYAMLKMLAGRLGLDCVLFKGFLSDDELAAQYRAADLFVSASRHEGFCLPLLEAMMRDVPVIARNCGGMPEALAGSGVLYDSTDPRELAVLMQRLLTDPDLRSSILASQAERIASLKSRDLDAACRAIAGM
jgi:glycosyltransferase involved in cell wall biosynthesis